MAAMQGMTTMRNQSAGRVGARRQQMEREATDLIAAVLSEVERGEWSEFVTRPELMEEARNHWRGWMIEEDVARKLYDELRARHPEVVERKRRMTVRGVRRQARVFYGVRWRKSE